MFKKKNEFREKLLREKAEEINYQIEKISQRRKEMKKKKIISYCEEYRRKVQAQEMLRVLDRV